MVRNLFLVFIFFGSLNLCFGQTKKTTTTSKKKAVPIKTTKPINAIIKQKPLPKIDDKVDSLPPKTENIDKKVFEKPINGPIPAGPKSYETQNTTIESQNIKTINSKKRKVLNTKKWLWGLQLGVNAANMKNFSEMIFSGVNIPAHKPINRLVGGLFMQYNISKKIILQPEIQFSQQGSQIKDSLNKYQFKVNFINAPILLKTQIGKGKIKYNIMAGPYIGYAISKKSTRIIGGHLINSKIEFENDFNAFGEKDNRYDWGAIGGFGGQYYYKKLLVSTEFRYQLGFANPIIYNSDQNKTAFQTGRNRIFSAQMGVYFPF